MSAIDIGQGLRDRVLAFFAANPEESLTAADISRKFSVGIRLVPEALIPAVAGGQLRLNAHGDYSPGPKLSTQAAEASPPATPQPRKPRASPAPRPAAGPMPPASSLKVESGIPMPDTVKHVGRRSLYADLFERMKPGDSFAIPTASAARAIGIAKQWGKRRNAKFAMRTDGTESRIWRTS
jgi:hypothetical protein